MAIIAGAFALSVNALIWPGAVATNSPILMR